MMDKELYRLGQEIKDSEDIDMIMEYLNLANRLDVRPSALLQRHIPIIRSIERPDVDVASVVLGILGFEEGSDKLGYGMEQQILNKLPVYVQSGLGLWKYVETPTPLYCILRDVTWSEVAAEVKDIQKRTGEDMKDVLKRIYDHAKYSTAVRIKWHNHGKELAALIQAELPLAKEIDFMAKDPEFELKRPVYCFDYIPNLGFTDEHVSRLYDGFGVFARFVKRLGDA